MINRRDSWDPGGVWSLFTQVDRPLVHVCFKLTLELLSILLQYLRSATLKLVTVTDSPNPSSFMSFVVSIKLKLNIVILALYS